ncbi:MAG: DUF559 domain-containing protein [bacterium]
MPLPYDPRLKRFARELRANLTDAERLLWHHLRGQQMCGVLFYRQKPIGQVIVDFYAPRARLVVELDGGQHYESSAVDRDARRTTFLATQGLTVLRFSILNVLQQTDAVLESIHSALRP